MSQVLIIGASRGIGLEFVRQYAADGARVVASARDGAGLERLRAAGAAQGLTLDVTDAASVGVLARAIDGLVFDTVIYNAGAYGPRIAPPDAPARDDFDAVMRSNVFGAMQLLPQLAGALAPGARVAVISSRMGSIGLRSGGGSGLYRASKAALNSVLKDLSITLAGRAVCVAFHPGWVQTDMGGAQAELTPERSVADMRRVLAGLTAEHNGAFLNHDGAALAW
jgi:NAD(P)-dependent dehydrogenase (short-subunit alcohol dehydrogenase family)